MGIDITRLNTGPAGGARPSIQPASATPASEPEVTSTGFIGADFGDALKQAVGALGDLSARADANALKAATGEPVDIHEVMLSMEQASLGFQTALQVRNKLVEAYQEIMRINI